MSRSVLRIWSYRRPDCDPSGGTVLAKTGSEALKLLNYAHGFCTGCSVYSAETGEKHSQNWLGEITQGVGCPPTRAD